MEHNKKAISIVIFTLIAVIVLGVGYAAITAINLTINSNVVASLDYSSFNVKFKNDQGDTTSINATNITINDLSATFDTTGLTKAGDKSTVIFTVKNYSSDLNADLTLTCNPPTGYNSEYFNVPVCKFGNNTKSITLNAGGITTVAVEVEVAKTPIEIDQITQVVANITAQPSSLIKYASKK